MNDRRSSADLGASVEAWLSAFPLPERDWESDARAVEARLTESARGSTDASLLAAPLPCEPGEPGATSASTTPLTNSGVRTQSLAELARLSVEKKRASEREMARQSLALAAQPPSAAQAQALRDLEQRAPRALPNVSPALRGSSASAVSPAVSPGAAPGLWPKVALATSGLALAAAALLWSQRPEPLAPLVNNPVPSAVGPSATTAPHALPSPSAATLPVAPAPQAVEPSNLPAERTAAPEGEGESASAKAVAAAAPPSAPLKADKVAPRDAHGTRPPSPQGTEKPVAQTLPADPELRPADSTGGELPGKPSTGAVQAALGSVMSGARRCVAGDEAASSAVVVFGSDGRVQHVTVTGPAAGKASGACIEAQLARARVQPFAAANFSVSATVRPD